MSEKYAQEFQSIIEKAKSLEKPMRVAVAGADNENILKGVFEAEAEGWVKPVLIGSHEKIRETLEAIGCKDRKYDLQPINDSDSPFHSNRVLSAPVNFGFVLPMIVRSASVIEPSPLRSA